MEDESRYARILWRLYGDVYTATLTGSDAEHLAMALAHALLPPGVRDRFPSLSVTQVRRLGGDFVLEVTQRKGVHYQTILEEGVRVFWEQIGQLPEI